MSKNSRKVTQKPEGRFVNCACELQLNVRQSLSVGRIGDFPKVDLYIFRSNDSGRRGKRCHSFWYGTAACTVAGVSDGIMREFFCGLFPGFFTHWFYVECKKHGFLKRFIGWIDKIVTKNKDKIHKYGPLAIFAYVAVPIPGTGTWTGSIIAGVLNMRPGITIFCVMCGNAVAGMIVMLASSGVIHLISRL